MQKLLKIILLVLTLSTAIFAVSKINPRWFTFLRFPVVNEESEPDNQDEQTQADQTNQISTNGSQEKQFTTYKIPNIPQDKDYTILLVGDSMTKALGPYPYQLSVRMNEAYPNKGFIIENYSRGSTNIESLPALIKDNTLSNGERAAPVIDRDYDILIVESMGYNPIIAESQSEALKQQEQILNRVISSLINQNPEGLIIFLATIAPSKEKYAEGVRDLTPTERAGRVEQRRAFIENFIDYAQSKNIPLINVYDESLNPNGSANLEYIRADDYIHPSQKGVEFIQNQIADFIIERKFLKK